MGTHGTAQTILIADDDPQVREVMGRFLEGRGWVVLVARDGEEALRIVESYPDDIDLLITDVLMPKLDGFTLAAQVVERRPQVNVLYVSGHVIDSQHVRDGLRETGRFFLRKLFSRDDLLRIVSAALDQTVEATDAFAVIVGHHRVTARALRDSIHTDKPPRCLRYQVTLPVRYRVPESSPWTKAVTQNLSRSGMLFATFVPIPRRLGLDEEPALDFRLALPSQRTESVEIIGRGTVARVVASKAPGEPIMIGVAVKHYRTDNRQLFPKPGHVG